MKKIFTLAATLFAAICMNAGDVTIALTSMTAGENSYAYDGAEIKAKNNNVYIELPGANVQGSITIKGSSNKSDRFLYIYGEGGTVKDESRAIEMKSDGGTINFSASDIILVSEVPYLLFSTTDDFKFKKFNYTYEEGKAIVSTVESLTGVSANGVAMSADEFSNLQLTPDHRAGFPNEEFAAAPTFVFYRHTVITYEDESTKEINDSIEVVGVEDVQGDWAASATIGGIEYSVYAGKAVAVTITYMDGETVLGTEIIAEADYAEDYVNFESKPLATFLGWFSDPELTTPVDFTIPVYTDITVYAKFEKAYASSLNIEQLVLDNGKKYDIKSALLASGYDYKDINELDSLNDEKTARNEPYLGLKIKKQGGYIACNVQAGHTIRVKFGYVAEDVKAYANDQEMTLAPVENALEVLEFTAAEETFVKLETTSGSTVVIKQIMIDEAIQAVTLPIPTGINNAEEAVKAVKVIRDGQLFIEKNGVLFNAQGARL
ncbi:MAG: InlB B-repeat-containing protein [Paludibacteraceae bacterium]|nr:InlB B-repeat-containing protein [Paludibacteraceae bacterium]